MIIFSLDKTDVDERLNKDMADYVSMRIGRSPTIQVSILENFYLSLVLRPNKLERLTVESISSLVKYFHLRLGAYPRKVLHMADTLA
jgi:hypothetical protein